MAQKAKWTFMVYMAGDNDLEGSGYYDLREMKSVGSSAELAVVAQFDRRSDQKTSRYDLTAGSDLQSDCVMELPSINTGDPNNLIDFIQWASHEHEADNYALILWNHGNGWKDFDVYDRARELGGAASVESTAVRSITEGRGNRALFSSSLDKMVYAAVKRGILIDRSAADFLDNQELQKVLAKTYRDLEGKLRILGFDACLMNMLEITYQVRDWCQIVAGSQDVEPRLGWPYDTILTALADKPQMTAEELARTIVQRFIASYEEENVPESVTQSAILQAHTEPLCQAVSSLGSALAQAVKSQGGVDLVLDALYLGQRFADTDYIDLKRFAEMLIDLDPKGAVGGAAQTVIERFESVPSAVLAAGKYGEMVSHANGVSVYLPSRFYDPLYEDLDFAREFQWDEFLRAFHPNRHPHGESSGG